MTPDTRGLGHRVPTTTHGSTGENAMYRVRSKRRGNEMGAWKRGCSEVRMDNTGSPDGQERDTEGLSSGSCVPPSPDTLDPHSQLASTYGWAAGPKASFSDPVDWEPLPAKQAQQSTRHAIFQNTYKLQKRATLWKSSLVTPQVSKTAFPLGNLHVTHSS